MMTLSNVWVFHGAGGRFASAVFGSVEAAEAWVVQHGLTGILTEYFLDVAPYEWALAKCYFEPKDDSQKTPDFIQKFTSAHQRHVHFEDGVRQGGAV